MLVVIRVRQKIKKSMNLLMPVQFSCLNGLTCFARPKESAGVVRRVESLRGRNSPFEAREAGRQGGVNS